MLYDPLASDDGIDADSKINVEIQKYGLIYRLCLIMLSVYCSRCKDGGTKDHTALHQSLSTTFIMTGAPRIEYRHV